MIPLAGGRERQLTHDGKNIDEVCWTRQGLIIFSSNRAGNTNLWAMRASGGPAVQITKGAGPDLGMRISADQPSEPVRAEGSTIPDHGRWGAEGGPTWRLWSLS